MERVAPSDPGGSGSGGGQGANRLPLRVGRTLTVAPLVAILFFTVSGGAYGLEELVGSVGPGLALALLLVIPLIWSLPIGLMVAELASAMPLEGGYYQWVKEALGRFWGFEEGWLSWLFTFVDMAIYPALFIEYLRPIWAAWFGREMDWSTRWIIALMVIWTSVGINLRGAKRVGHSSMIAFAFCMLPFVIFCVVGFERMKHVPWHPVLSGESLGSSLALGLSVVLWNYAGWDNGSTFAGEIKSPGRTIPRALFITVPLVALAYILPMAAGLGQTTDAGQWTTGFLPQIARHMGSSPAFGWLAGWLVLGALVSSWCLFNSQLLYCSRLPMVLAEEGFLPRSIARISSPAGSARQPGAEGENNGNGVPARAVILCAVIYSAFALLSFNELVVADVILYSLALALEFLALITLRRKRPDLPRPFRVPLGNAGLIAITLPPMLLAALVIVATISTNLASQTFAIGLLVSAGIVFSGPVVYYLSGRLGAASRRAGAPLPGSQGD